MIGRLTRTDINLQFASSRLDGLSFAVTPVHTYSSDGTRGPIATGFLWRVGPELFLITNWHVVNNKDLFSGRADHAAIIPNELELFPAILTPTDHDSKFIAPVRRFLRVQLFDTGGEPRWLQHPEFKERRIDVVAVPISDPLPSWRAVNDYKFERLFHAVGQDVFVVGYPLTNVTGWMPPLWKRGALSTDPLLPTDDRPLFLVDVASSEGMSGSPVFRRVFGPAAMSDLTVKLESVVATEFVGVYSGRLKSKELERVNIGYAWYANVIDEILTTRSPGTTC